MIFHILTGIEPGNPCQLQKYIDNRNGDKTIGIKIFFYNVGYYKIKQEEFVNQGSIVKVFYPGLYKIEDIIEKFKQAFLNLSIEETSGMASITPIGQYIFDIKASNGIMSMLGFRIEGEYFIMSKVSRIVGIKPIGFKFPKELRVCLEQLNTKSNFINGAPSNILEILPVHHEEYEKIEPSGVSRSGCQLFQKIIKKEYSKSVLERFVNPSFKNLQNGNITELTVFFVDEKNEIIKDYIFYTIEFCIK